MNQLSETIHGRMEKRQVAVQMVKASVEVYLALRHEHALHALHAQPDAKDITISKRSWNRAFLNWKHSVLRAADITESDAEGLFFESLG